MRRRRYFFRPDNVQSPFARALYKIVMGQIVSYINDHPEHIPDYVKKTIALSIAKRVVGDLTSRQTTEYLMRLARQETKTEEQDG